MGCTFVKNIRTRKRKGRCVTETKNAKSNVWSCLLWCPLVTKKQLTVVVVVVCARSKLYTVQAKQFELPTLLGSDLQKHQ